MMVHTRSISLGLLVSLLIPAWTGTLSAQQGEPDESEATEENQEAAPEDSAEAESAAGESAADEQTAEGAAATSATPAAAAQPTPAAAATTPAPAAPAPSAPPATEPTSNPPTEISVSVADAQTAAGSDDTDAEDQKNLIWRNSSFLWANTVTKNSFDRGAQLSYNPTYIQTFGVRPRWYLSDTFSIRFSQNWSVELTDSDSTATKREVHLSDTRIDFREGRLFEYYDVTVGAGPRVTLPISPASQARERILGTGLVIAAQRPVEGIADGLTFGLGFSYLHHWASSNQLDLNEPRDCLQAGNDESVVCDYVGGSASVTDTFSLAPDITLDFADDFSATFGFGWGWSYAPQVADATVGDNILISGSEDFPADDDATHWRNTWGASLSLGWAVNDWVGLDLGLDSTTVQREAGDETFIDPDDPSNSGGSRTDLRNPFWNSDTTVSLTMTIGLDDLYRDIKGGSEESAPVDHRGSQEEMTAASTAGSEI